MKRIKISLIINFIIVFLVILSTVIMYSGIRFMPGDDILLDLPNLGMLSFFTVDSNIFMGIVALIFSIYEIRLLKKDIKEIPKKIYILKLMGTAGVSLTFFVVFSYLGIIAGYYPMLMNSNLFYHLIIPVLSIITFVFFEKTNKIKFKESIYGLVPMLIYSIYYISNVLIHMHNGKVSTKYDFYWFVQNGIWTIVIVASLILFINSMICILLWKGNNIKEK